nr:PREDICTED: collagen alpha-1(I) chain isoform X2 [Anolis carolinensis]|eukprot:XP_008106624.1 PREDICTED: collagen alpha-1(I) chain isoform X2 [Anolis carolinensis]
MPELLQGLFWSWPPMWGGGGWGLLLSVHPATGSSTPLPPACASLCSSFPQRPPCDMEEAEGEAPSLVDSQPIPFSANPFVLANRKGGARLGGPPLGYGKGGVLKTSLCAKVPVPGEGEAGAWREPPGGGSSASSAQQASVHFVPAQSENKPTKPGTIQPISRLRPGPGLSPGADGREGGPNPFQPPEGPRSSAQSSPRSPRPPPSPDEATPVSAKQVYKGLCGRPCPSLVPGDGGRIGPEGNREGPACPL